MRNIKRKTKLDIKIKSILRSSRSFDARIEKSTNLINERSRIYDITSN